VFVADLSIGDIGLDVVGDVEGRLDGGKGGRVAVLVGRMLGVPLELFLPVSTAAARVRNALGMRLEVE
jgi:hypothetical protein